MISLYESLATDRFQYNGKIGPFIIANSNLICCGKYGHTHIYDSKGNVRIDNTKIMVESNKFPVSFLLACRYAECIFGCGGEIIR